MGTKYDLLKTGLAGAALAIALLLHACDSPETSAVLDDVNYTGKIRISLAHPFDPKNDDYELLFATGTDATALGICLAKDSATCAPGTQGYYAADLILSDGGHNFFKTRSSALLDKDMIITAVASGGTGQALDKRNIQFACAVGSASKRCAVAATTPPPPPAPTPTPTTTPTTTAADTATNAANAGGGNGGQGNNNGQGNNGYDNQGGAAGGFGGGGGGW